MLLRSEQPTLNIVPGQFKSIANLFHNIGKLTGSSLMASTALKEGSSRERAVLEIKSK